jgi:tRNA nucleotidyltransferase (CCA-adding enzyme)
MTSPTKRVTVPAHARPVLRTIGRIADQLDMRAYAVGGCVRDWLMRRRANEADLDVAVEGDGIELSRAAARELGGTVTTHEQFGTATLHLGGPPTRRIDFATCRRETYARPAAYPKVAAGTLRDDLFRRDFTVNAMAVALNRRRLGTLIDPFHGARDLRRKELRILHGRSFVDDPSRLLRGVRFLVRFGLRWEPRTERAAREAVRAGAIGWLNTGRLRKELDRMTAEANPRACLERFAELFVRVGPPAGRRQGG